MFSFFLLITAVTEYLSLCPTSFFRSYNYKTRKRNCHRCKSP